MEKRMILAFVLSIAIVIGYQHLFGPAPEKRTDQKPGTAQTQLAGKDNVPGAPAGVPGVAPEGTVPGAEILGGLTSRGKNPLRWIAVKTPLYTATIATAGGGVQSFLLERYTDKPGPRGEPLDIVGSGSIRPLPLDPYLLESQPPFPVLPVFFSDAPETVTVKEGEKTVVRLAWESQQGIRILREFRFTGGKYEFELEQKVSNGSTGSLRFRQGIELSQVFHGELRGDSYSFFGGS